MQLLTPQHRGPLGVEALNEELQRVVQRKLWGVRTPTAEERGKVGGKVRRPGFFLHDRVIQTRNNYDLGVMNGTIGEIVEMDEAHTGKRGGDLKIRTEDGSVVEYLAEEGHAKDLQLAYALTIHKAQGSEFPCVVVVAHRAHSFMASRNLLYTAATRAKECLVLVGDAWGMRNAAAKVETGRRKTWLSVLPLGRTSGAGIAAELDELGLEPDELMEGA